MTKKVLRIVNNMHCFDILIVRNAHVIYYPSFSIKALLKVAYRRGEKICRPGQLLVLYNQ